MLIGEVARRSGLTASTLRYYERAGLLAAPPRSSKRRQYQPRVMGRIRIIQVARQAGFTIAETRAFLSGFPSSTAPSARWQKLAQRKLQELDLRITQVMQMKTLLQSSFHCGCRSIEDCERLMTAGKRPNSS
jgi:MerR family transcriptional regulator, redox-sensitive transcriptional activator SoxR